MNIDAEVIEFRVPTESNKTLFVWDIVPTVSDAYIYEALRNIYSAFGALFWLKVGQNAAVAQPGFYAVVKFFSAAAASKAQRATHGKCLFQKSPLKVRLCAGQNPAGFRDVRALGVVKCQELANHYLGFNGWSSRVVTLKNVSSGDPGEPPVGSGSPMGELRYGCIVELGFPAHGMSCRGVGVAEEHFEHGAGPEDICVKRGQLQKRAKDRAMMDAFRKVLLVILGSGKIVVECKLDADEILPDETLEGVIKVNDISWSQFECGEEEDFPDLTLNLLHLP